MLNLGNSAGIVIQRVGAAVDPAPYLGGARKIWALVVVEDEAAIERFRSRLMRRNESQVRVRLPSPQKPRKSRSRRRK